MVLMRERGARFPDGLSVLVHSAVPEGKGVSSSAAVEVAVMQARTRSLLRFKSQTWYLTSGLTIALASSSAQWNAIGGRLL